MGSNPIGLIFEMDLKHRELLNEIQKTIDGKFIVIVEGAKDKSALANLGFKNVEVLQGKPFYKFIEKIAALAVISKTKVVILTDLDRKGKQFYTKIKKELVKEGVKINDKLREILFKEKISHIEGLATFIEHVNPNN